MAYLILYRRWRIMCNYNHSFISLLSLIQVVDQHQSCPENIPTQHNNEMRKNFFKRIKWNSRTSQTIACGVCFTQTNECTQCCSSRHIFVTHKISMFMAKCLSQHVMKPHPKLSQATSREMSVLLCDVTDSPTICSLENFMTVCLLMPWYLEAWTNNTPVSTS